MNKINIRIILICIFLCVCVVCIGITIPNSLISNSNDEVIVKYGKHKYFVYGDAFYSIIEKIKEKNEETYIYVKGLEINDTNHRGKYYFKIDSDTEIIMQYTKRNMSDLKVGQRICITSTETIIKSTGLITKVAKIDLLD